MLQSVTNVPIGTVTAIFNKKFSFSSNCFNLFSLILINKKNYRHCNGEFFLHKICFVKSFKILIFHPVGTRIRVIIWLPLRVFRISIWHLLITDLYPAFLLNK